MSSGSSLLLIDKPSQVTSFSALSPIKRSIAKKVGHCGTLDKFATGLLIVLTGSYTRLNQLFSSLDKTYEAVVEFGKQTDTLDPEGTITHSGSIPTRTEVQQVISSQFLGSIMQEPPVFSALHIDGKRAHVLARQGEEVTIPKRRVTIYSLTVEHWDPPFAHLAIHCSKGTYIRSLARDIALACNSRAYVKELKRTAIGPYKLTEAALAEDEPALRAQIQQSEKQLARLPNIAHMVLNKEATRRLWYGNLPNERGIISSTAKQQDTHVVLQNEHAQSLAVAALNDALLPHKLVGYIGAKDR